MLKEHIIKDSDTLQSIATAYYGDPSKWVDIAEYNGLDYPYITDNNDLKTKIPASGKVTFYVSTASGLEIVIPKGVIVSISGSDKQYKTLQAAVLQTGALSVETEVECLYAGRWGNCGAGDINTIETTISGAPDLKITNKQAFVNGIELNIKKVGEALYIPVESITEFYATESAADFLTLIGGEDLVLDADNDLGVDNYNDLASAMGLQNIANSIKHRLETEKGELAYHPEYGSNLHLLVGRSDPFIDRMIELEIKECILQDSRISSVEVLSISKRGTALSINLELKLVGQDRGQRLTLPYRQ